MGRQKLIKYDHGAYHVNAKTNNAEWFPIPLSDCWNIFTYYLNKTKEKYKIEIHAFTLMSNHFHLLCSTPEENLDKAMNYFMQMTSKGINLAAGRKNHLYGGKYFWTHTSTAEGYALMYKYILRNPVRAKLCKGVENYPWTSFVSNKKIQLTKNPIDELVPKEDPASWINFCPQDFEENIFQKIFKKTEIKDCIHPISRQKINLNKYLTR
ncbi:MAG: transposase [Bdellovibrionota bacterium]